MNNLYFINHSRRRCPRGKTPVLAGLSVLLFGGLIIAGSIGCEKRKTIRIDGSSTVYLLTEAVSEEYSKKDGSVQVTVGISGTGGGFKKFCKGETDITDASRTVKESERKRCGSAGIKFREFPVAYDGLAVLVNKKNTRVEKLTVEELNKIFRSENPARTWKDVNPAWPGRPIKVFAPGQDSGTYDYFVEEIIGKKKKMRPDASFSEDDNVLVTGIAGETDAIGFFGLAYYEENKDKLKLVAVVNPKTGQAVRPGQDTVRSGEYAPLSRPIFIYVDTKALLRPEVGDFMRFYMKQAARLSREVGYVPLPDKVYSDNLNSLAGK